jgi:hypothetical protein
MENASYTKTKQGDAFVFYVTPASKVLGGCSGSLLAIIVAVAVGFIVGWVFMIGGLIVMDEIGAILGGVGGVVAFFVAGYYMLTLDRRKKNHQKPSTFEVSANQIRANGQTYSKEDIHRLIIQNAYRNVPELVLTGNHSTGAGIGYDIRKANERISYSLVLEMGGRAHQLAGGMDDTTAFGLLTDVSKVLGMETKG